MAPSQWVWSPLAGRASVAPRPKYRWLLAGLANFLFHSTCCIYLYLRVPWPRCRPRLLACLHHWAKVSPGEESWWSQLPAGSRAPLSLLPHCQQSSVNAWLLSSPARNCQWSHLALFFSCCLPRILLNKTMVLPTRFHSSRLCTETVSVALELLHWGMMGLAENFLIYSFFPPLKFCKIKNISFNVFVAQWSIFMMVVLTLSHWLEPPVVHAWLPSGGMR